MGCQKEHLWPHELLVICVCVTRLALNVYSHLLGGLFLGETEILQLEPFQLMVPPQDHMLNLILSMIKIRVLLLSK